MKYKTHVAGGLVAGVVALSLMEDNSGVELAVMTGAVIGSLFPDIDHKGSYIGRRMKATSHIASSLFGHRGITHSPIMMTFFTLLLFLTSELFIASTLVDLWLLGFYMGILSHIFLDMLTKGGVPLLYPFSKKKIALTKMKTGSIWETMVFVVLILTLGYFGVNYLPLS